MTKWLEAGVKQSLFTYDPKTGVYQLSSTLKTVARPLTALEVVNA